MITLLLTYVIWNCFAFMDGKIDAYYWYLHSNAEPLNTMRIKTQTTNIHKEFTFRRLFVGMSCYLIAILIFDNWHSILFGASLVLSFSFWHNGAYYMKRNDLNQLVYIYRFFDSSNSSTAKFEFNFIQRLSLKVASLFILYLSLWLQF